MEPDDWYILVLIDAIVSIPLFYTVMDYLTSQHEKKYINDMEIYFGVFIVVFVISTIALKRLKRSFNE
jgi:small neutral amino acid transporter SnatA (MarC family)